MRKPLEEGLGVQHCWAWEGDVLGHWQTPPAELVPRLQKCQYPWPSREVQLLLLAGVPPEHEV